MQCGGPVVGTRVVTRALCCVFSQLITCFEVVAMLGEVTNEFGDDTSHADCSMAMTHVSTIDASALLARGRQWPGHALRSLQVQWAGYIRCIVRGGCYLRAICAALNPSKRVATSVFA